MKKAKRTIKTVRGQQGFRQGVSRLLTAVLAGTLAVAMLAGCQTQTTPEGQQSSGTTTPASGATSGAATVGPVTFTDDLGSSITVDNPQRVVATMGSFAKVWELAGGTLVGVSDDVDTYSGYALTSPNVERVGDFTAIDMEKVIALEPDFVIMTGASTGRAGAASQLDFKETLEASGITVAYFTVTTFPDYLRMLETCCKITGRSDLFTANGEDVQSKIEAIIAKVPSAGEKPRVLLMTTYSGGTRVQNSDTQTGAILAELGVTNIADENRSLLSDFSLEAVIESDPDFIFVVPMGENTAEAMRSLEELTASHPAWSQIGAVANGHYITLEPDLYLYKPNDKWADAYQELFDYLYA